MSITKQLFVYNMSGITRDNNFPLLRFDTEIDMYAFITRLKSTARRSDTTVPYFVLNNPQLLPSFVRNMHVYRRKKAYTLKTRSSETESESDSDSDDEYEEFDGMFILHENLDELRRCAIENNTLCATGFVEAIRNYTVG